MIELKIKSKNKDDNFKVKETMHHALVGSPAYIESEIAICDNKEDESSFFLVIGNNNTDDVSFTINSEDIVFEEKEG